MITIIFLRMVCLKVSYLLEILEVLVPIFLLSWNDDPSFSFKQVIGILIKQI